MSVQKDDAGRRRVRVEVEVPGTPEEVWQAIATGPGVSSWFVPTEIREDGSVVSSFGPGMDAVARRTVWEPPHRFAAESEMAPGVPMATEWIVEARDGGKCVVRVVHSLFTEKDDWDDQLGAIELGWPGYFHILTVYLAWFRGQACSAFKVMGLASPPAEAVWEKLSVPLGLGGAAVGERRESPPESPPLAGVVERTGDAGHPHSVLLRLDVPCGGVAHLFAMGMGGQVFVSVRFYLYGPEAAAAAGDVEPRWRAWMQERFPLPAGAGAECG